MPRHHRRSLPGHEEFAATRHHFLIKEVRKSSQIPPCLTPLIISLTTPLALPSHLSPLTSHLSPLTSHLSPLTSHLSPLTSHLSPLTSHLSLLTSHFSLLTSHLSLTYNSNHRHTVSHVRIELRQTVSTRSYKLIVNER